MAHCVGIQGQVKGIFGRNVYILGPVPNVVDEESMLMNTKKWIKFNWENLVWSKDVKQSKYKKTVECSFMRRSRMCTGMNKKDPNEYA